MEVEEVMESSIPESTECDALIPRGGPIYLPNMVGRSTTIPQFRNSLINELQNLEAELGQGVPEFYDDDDLSYELFLPLFFLFHYYFYLFVHKVPNWCLFGVDDLKVFTDDELMDMALKEVFHGKDNNKNHPPLLDKSNPGRCHEKNSRRKRRGTNKSILESGCIEKVERVVRTKQKQEEDKAAARLRSFNPVCKISESALQSTITEMMRSLNWSTSSIRKVNTASLEEHIHVLHPEVVLSLEVYHNVRKRVKTQELLVLGDQTLTALRDKIYCSMDQVMQKAGQKDPSGYFLIEDVFYNDLRDPSAIDYTRPILDWLQNSKEEAQKKWEYIMNGEQQQKQKAIMGEVSLPPLPRFTSVEMHKKRFCDLRFQLGAGYLCCHQLVDVAKVKKLKSPN